MIFKEEVPAFPPGVEFTGSRIFDSVTGDEVPLNGTAQTMLSLVDGERTVEEICVEVARRYGVDETRAIKDFLQLAWRLNERCLLNIGASVRSRLRLAPQMLQLFLFNLFTGRLLNPWHRRRLEVRDTGVLACFLSVSRGLLPRCLAVGCMTALCVVVGVQDVVTPSLLAALLGIISVFSLGLTLHEAAHAIALLPEPSYLSVRGPVFKVQHRCASPLRGFVVSMAGPAVPGALGLLVLIVNSFAVSEFLTFAGVLLLFNLLGATAASPDGRNALRSLCVVPSTTPKGVRQWSRPA